MFFSVQVPVASWYSTLSPAPLFFGLQASEVPARSKIVSLAPDDLGESGAKVRNGRGNCRLPNTAEVDRVATVGGVCLRGRKQKKRIARLHRTRRVRGQAPFGGVVRLAHHFRPPSVAVDLAHHLRPRPATSPSTSEHLAVFVTNNEQPRTPPRRRRSRQPPQTLARRRRLVAMSAQ